VDTLEDMLLSVLNDCVQSASAMKTHRNNIKDQTSCV